MDVADNRPSRYRSTRQTGDRNPTATTSGDPILAPPGDTVIRSPSRYHRKINVSQASPDSTGLDLPSADTVGARWSRPGAGVERIGRPQDAFAMSSREYLVSPSASLPQDCVLTPKLEVERQKRLDGNMSARQLESSRPGSGEDGSSTLDTARFSGRQADGRRDSPMFEVKPVTSSAPQNIRATTVDVRKEKSASCFGGLFGRRKTVVGTQSPRKQAETRPMDASVQFIKQGGGGIVPGIDVPKSAVNAGERHVLVEHNRQSIKFPVEASTTADDLLDAATGRFQDTAIDARSHVLVELYSKAGIQRPLRRYEPIRDVMNSWDEDHQNSLIVLPATSVGSSPDLLYASTVPSRRPEEQSFVLYYSQKVGKWDRRHIILRSDGQIVAKKNSTALDKDATSVCHLSDFDVYTPTIRQMSKKIRPPKKLCFAVRSQQKTSMFESTTDFVHFFCTDRKEDAIMFYTAAQTWRSWYLVNVLGEGKRSKTKTAVPSRTPTVRQSETTPRAPEGQLVSLHPFAGAADRYDHRHSLDNEKSAAGTFDRKQSTTERPPRCPARQHAVQTGQVLSDNEPLANYARRASVDDPGLSASFADSSLLGRSYSVRRTEGQGRDTGSPAIIAQSPNPNIPPSAAIRRDTSRRHPTRGPSTRGPSSAPIHRPTTPVTGTAAGSDLARSGSTRIPSRPLVDLTPNYREPPQHTRRGRAFVPQMVGPGGLISSATSPDDPLGVPSSTDWRGRLSQHRSVSDNRHDDPEAKRSRSRSQSRPASRDRARTFGAGQTHHHAPLQGQTTLPHAHPHGSTGTVNGTAHSTGDTLVAQDAFVPGGLVEQTVSGWGDGATGRGLGRGEGPPGRPLVDLRGESEFVKGSLLSRES